MESSQTSGPNGIEQPNIIDLRERVTHLKTLLDDPHPGLMTWREAYGKAAKRVLEFYDAKAS